MSGEAKKLHLIQEILEIENDAVLAEVEIVIVKSKKFVLKRKSFKDFTGVMTDEEVNELEKIIEEGCERINTNDWE